MKILISRTLTVMTIFEYRSAHTKSIHIEIASYFSQRIRRGGSCTVKVVGGELYTIFVIVASETVIAKVIVCAFFVVVVVAVAMVLFGVSHHTHTDIINTLHIGRESHRSCVCVCVCEFHVRESPSHVYILHNIKWFQPFQISTNIGCSKINHSHNTDLIIIASFFPFFCSFIFL